MRLSLPKIYTKKLWRAIAEFDLIQADDKIILGFSGGKDSAFLAYAFSVMQKSAPIPFEIQAVHIDLGFDPDFEYQQFKEFFQRIEIPLHIEHTRIQEMVFAHGEKSACARCAYLRRGAVNAYAIKEGCNKVAYAHHYDDAVETFLMSIFYAGQITTFLPSTYLSESQLTVIRPMVYLREKEVREAKKFVGFQPAKSLCPLDGRSKRHEIKELIGNLVRKNKMVFYNISAAMCENQVNDLWPARLSGKELEAKLKNFWAPKYK